MSRWLPVLVLLLGAEPAFAKYLCDPGRFVLTATVPSVPALQALELRLGEGTAALTDSCAPVRGRGFHPSGYWLYRLRARWGRCSGGRSTTLRARFDQTGPYCDRLTGVIRLGNRRAIRFVGERVPE